MKINSVVYFRDVNRNQIIAGIFLPLTLVNSKSLSCQNPPSNRAIVSLGQPSSFYRPPSERFTWSILLVFGSVCTPNKLAAVLLAGIRALLPHPNTDSDRCADTTTICDQHTIQSCADTTTIRDQHKVRKLTLNRTSFWGFFLPYDGLGVSRVQS